LTNYDGKNFYSTFADWSFSATPPTIPLPCSKSSPSTLKSFPTFSPFFFPFKKKNNNKKNKPYLLTKKIKNQKSLKKKL
jgi:hypothetical protein